VNVYSLTLGSTLDPGVGWARIYIVHWVTPDGYDPGGGGVACEPAGDAHLPDGARPYTVTVDLVDQCGADAWRARLTNPDNPWMSMATVT